MRTFERRPLIPEWRQKAVERFTGLEIFDKALGLRIGFVAAQMSREQNHPPPSADERPANEVDFYPALRVDSLHSSWAGPMSLCYGLRHLSGLPFVVARTRSTIGVQLGLIDFARSMASAWVGRTALARSEPGRRTA
jgi:hypothetical protein